MKNILKLLSAILALLMVFSLFTACGSDTSKDVDEPEVEDVDEKEDEDEDEEEEEEETEEETEPVITAADVLVGNWEAKTIIESADFILNLNFAADGTLKMEHTEENYEQYVALLVENIFEENNFDALTDEGKSLFYAQFGATTYEETFQFFCDMMKTEMPYDQIAAEFNLTGTWTIEGDTLKIDIDGDELVAETSLSSGVEAFNLTIAEYVLECTKL